MLLTYEPFHTYRRFCGDSRWRPMAEAFYSDPPRVARAFVLPFVTLYDAGIACWDAK